MARELDSANVDLIVAGHLHLTGTTEVNGIPIIQAGSQGETISIANALRDAAQAEVIASRPSVQAWQVAYRVCGSLGRTRLRSRITIHENDKKTRGRGSEVIVS